MSEKPILVIDNGSCTIKAGFSGDDHPTAIVRNAVGMTEYANLTDKDTFEKFVDANTSGDFKVRYPISKGSVTSWEDMETVWRHMIEDHLHISPEETNILITEPVGNPKSAREKIGEILFESLNFAGVSVATAPILPMYAAGRTTGIVLDIGDGTTQVVPVWGGYPITDAMQRVDFGGHEVTQLLSKERAKGEGLSSAKSTPYEVLRLVKEKACHVVPDYEQARQSPTQSTYELPNGQKVQLGEEVFKCPEFLFNPSRFDENDTNNMGVHQLLYKSIMKTNIDVRKDLYSNIVLSGGSTLFPGFADRLTAELKALVPPSVSINVVSHPARKYFTWIGGSVLSSLASFSSLLITKESWNEGSGRIEIGKVAT